MSFINLFILSYFGMMVNYETISVCVFLIYLMLFQGWVGYFYPIHTNRHYANMQQELPVFLLHLFYTGIVFSLFTVCDTDARAEL